jgi:hypothetical protein
MKLRSVPKSGYIITYSRQKLLKTVGYKYIYICESWSLRLSLYNTSVTIYIYIYIYILLALTVMNAYPPIEKKVKFCKSRRTVGIYIYTFIYSRK